jgi:hypothetical protein
VEADDGRSGGELRDERALGSALGHLDDVEAMAFFKLPEAAIHAPGVLDALAGPEAAQLAEEAGEGHDEACGAAAMYVDAVVLRGCQHAGCGCAGQDVDLVAEFRESACLIPGVRADAAEASLRRVLEGEQKNLHAGTSTGSATRCAAMAA